MTWAVLDCAMARRGDDHTLSWPGPAGRGAASCRYPLHEALEAGSNAREAAIAAFQQHQPPGYRAASSSGRSSGIARHIAAKAAEPDSITPSSRAWARASRSARSIGHVESPSLASTKQIAPVHSDAASLRFRGGTEGSLHRARR